MLLSTLAALAALTAQHPEGPYAWPAAEELVERSRSIVAGEVVDTRPHWDARRTVILTTVTLRVERTLLGSAGREVQFQVPGGIVGDTGMQQSHSPQFAVGERVLVFLASDPGRMPRVAGGEAGKRALVADGEGGEAILPALSFGGASRIQTLEQFARSLSDPALLGRR